MTSLRTRSCLPWMLALIVAWSHSFARADSGNIAADPAGPSHPVVPGFERFFAAGPSDPRGGELLLGELNCTSCHRAAESRRIDRKQAPILDEVGRRVRASYLRRFLADPHATKPGTTMPNALAGLPAAERERTVDALVHFLATTGNIMEAAPAPKFVASGRKLFHETGCTACHAPQIGGPLAGTVSVPLGDLPAKYTIASLTEFLKDPLHVRPSGRMPAPNLKDDEVRDVAHFLLRDLKVESLGRSDLPRIRYSYYEGSFDQLPDFERLKPTATGLGAAFDLNVSPRNDQFALKFDAVFEASHEGEYQFDLASDDGSRLWVDGRLVVENDGVHATQSKAGTVRLAKGVHEVTVGFFEQAGGEELRVRIAGPGLPQQELARVVAATREELFAKETEKPPRDNPDVLAIDPVKAQEGRTLFATLGCASCHQLSLGGESIHAADSYAARARPLDQLASSGGCLAAAPRAGTPYYALGESQRAALALAVAHGAAVSKSPPADRIASTMLRFNCYACHGRDGVGGVEQGRNALFSTTQQEMGDEGRIPPSLDGVGAKLTAEYLKHLFDQGANDRPYMRTRMPRYGLQNVGELVALFEQADPLGPVTVPPIDVPERRLKAIGRELIGDRVFGCVKCHNFGGVQATGIQSIDLTKMTRRLRHDWFHRYLLNPQAYRPGTRMPAAWPRGVSTVRDVLDGDAVAQIEAVWQYLRDGRSAGIPYGLSREMIELVPEDTAIIYRGFIEGAGPRAIAVGYPEKANLAFDAKNMRLALIWQGQFIDASMHWTGRGSGFQRPLGDAVLALPDEPAFARLANEQASWPATSATESGYRFRGYRLTNDRRPRFLYDYVGIHIEDFPNAVDGDPYPTIRRTFTLSCAEPPDDVYFRAAVADQIEPRGDGWYALGSDRRMRLETTTEPLIVEAQGCKELRVPIRFERGRAKLIQEFVW